MVKAWIKHFLLQSGLMATKTASNRAIQHAINPLQPVATDKPLIRLGCDADGGYLIPDDLDGIAYCFSPGVDTNASFEHDLADRGIQTFMADGSVNEPPQHRAAFHFTQAFLAHNTFGDQLSLKDWVNHNLDDYSGDLILQMDIEGSEYEVLFGAEEALLQRFRIAVIEFHMLNRLFDRYFLALADALFKKLLKVYEPVHIHPNNHCGITRRRGLEIPDVMEFTFLRKNRVTSRKPVDHYPHPLDRKNNPDRPEIPLPRCWQ